MISLGISAGFLLYFTTDVVYALGLSSRQSGICAIALGVSVYEPAWSSHHPRHASITSTCFVRGWGFVRLPLAK